jgi:hypothetical protein
LSLNDVWIEAWMTLKRAVRRSAAPAWPIAPGESIACFANPTATVPVAAKKTLP